MVEPSDCTLEKCQFRGWPAYRLSNGLVSLVAVPEIGGRIMACDLGDYPYLFVDPDLAGKLFSAEENQGDGTLAAWKNYGGDKTWPSPQGWDNEDQWHGPPDPLLDTGRYQVTGCQPGPDGPTLEMTSPADPRTGVQITRRVRLLPGSGRVQLDLAFRNISDRPRRWSIWDVVQLRAERTLPDGRLAAEDQCSMTAPLNPASRFEKGYWVMFGAEDNPQWSSDPGSGLVEAHYQWEIGKIGIDSSAGWIAFSNAAQGYAFAGRFTHFAGQEYPDQGSTVECWTIGRGKVANLDYEQSRIYLMEAEILSPFYTMQPGQSSRFQIEWGVCRCCDKILDVQDGGCISRRIRLQPVSGGLQLTGTFGVFDLGRLALAWRDRAGNTLHQQTLQPVSPLDLVRLDLAVQPPEGAQTLALGIITGSSAWQSLGVYTLPGA